LLLGALLAQLQGQFDYYVLSLSWAPEFCAQPGAPAGNKQECAAGRKIGFVVHGLWPESAQGRSPETCGPAKSVPKAVISFILPYMPSRDLIQHEWATHGTCTGQTPAEYFANVLQARSTLQIPVQFAALEEAALESPGQIEAQFAESNPTFPAGAFRTACRNAALTEVRTCFGKDLKPQACPATAEECKTPQIGIKPPR
jgi:ribonuclease T2